MNTTHATTYLAVGMLLFFSACIFAPEIMLPIFKPFLESLGIAVP